MVKVNHTLMILYTAQWFVYIQYLLGSRSKLQPATVKQKPSRCSIAVWALWDKQQTQPLIILIEWYNPLSAPWHHLWQWCIQPCLLYTNVEHNIITTLRYILQFQWQHIQNLHDGRCINDSQINSQTSELAVEASLFWQKNKNVSRDAKQVFNDKRCEPLPEMKIDGSTWYSWYSKD